MILQCQNCNARYLIPDQSLGADGRTVRCARCSHSWFEKPQIKEEKTAEEIPSLDAILDDINSDVKKQEEQQNETEQQTTQATNSNLPARLPRTSLTIKAAAAFLLVLVAGLSIFIKQPSLLGISSSKDFVLADVKIEKSANDQENSVEISGNIVNTSDEARKVPDLRIMLLDGSDYPLKSWEFSSDGKILNPHENMPFTSGELNVKLSLAKRMVVDLGTGIELKLRQKPQ